MSTALSRRKHEIALEREAATPGRPLRLPAHGDGVDGRVGDLVVFRAHCPARTTARVGTAQGQLEMACLQRSGNTAPAWMTARMSTAPGRQKSEVALGREVSGRRTAAK